MKLKFLIIVFSLFLVPTISMHGQWSQETESFTKQDTLRGSITPEREWWDVTYYHLDVKVNPDDKFISGKNLVQYKVIKPHNVLQIDLQSPLQITKVTQNGKELKVKNVGNAHFITLSKKRSLGWWFFMEKG